MTAQIVTQDDRKPFGPSLCITDWYRDGDGVARRRFARSIPGQLWERVAERAAS